MLMFINGQHCAASDAATMPVLDPATGENFESVPVANPADVDRAMAAAASAFQSWKAYPVEVRATIQNACATAMRDNAQSVAALLHLELGRPMPGCLHEISRAADLLDVYAAEALTLATEIKGEKATVKREPIGVVAAITPFNYPINLLLFKLGGALMAGCTVVAKPADDTPLSTLKLAELFHAAGLPAGVFNVVTGDRSVGEMLVAHKTPRKVAFTGSIPAGKAIAAAATATMKRVTLELGGQSPAIICADAYLEKAATAICRQAFANTGQFCYRVARIYVERAAYVPFVDLLSEKLRTLRLAPAGGEGDLGPLVNQRIFENSIRHIQDAIAKGARVMTGGTRQTGKGFDGGYFLPATLIADCAPDTLIMSAETFGPVLGVAPVDSAEDALRLSNETPFGLAAFVFTDDLLKGRKLCDALEAGSVWLNDIQRSAHDVPFGGMKESGLGREKGRWGIEAYLEWKTIYEAAP